MSLFIEFPPISTAEWEAAVRADLKGRDPGKIMYRAEDAPYLGEQPWPSRPWEIWAEVSDIAGARRARERGAEGLVVANPTEEWRPVLEGIHLHALAALGDWAAGLRGTIEGEFVPSGFQRAVSLPPELTIAQQIARVSGGAGEVWIVPVGPSYFQEIAKFRALRRLCPGIRLVARTFQSNLMRGTTEAMAAIIGGCDALIVGPSTGGESGERLALNTQLLLREESYFGQVADPAGGSWYIETLTAQLLRNRSETA